MAFSASRLPPRQAARRFYGKLLRNGVRIFEFQPRVLHGVHPTCVIPGCDVGFERCKIHHITWWRHGGHSDLDNLAHSGYAPLT